MAPRRLPVCRLLGGHHLVRSNLGVNDTKIPLGQVPAAFGNINNQFVGILVRIISAELYNCFSHVELTTALSFFSGRRLMAFLVSFVMIFIAFILMYIWPLFFNAFVAFGEHIQQLGSGGSRYLRLF